MTIITTPGPGAELLSPIHGDMRGRVNESLQADIQLVYEHLGEESRLIGRNAGLEIAGNIDILLCDQWRK